MGLLMITDSELKTGDLVFYLNSAGVPEHIAVFANHCNGVPYVIHATSHPYYSVMLTHLKPELDNQYCVMRPNNTNIAFAAVGILSRWVEHQVRFATTKKRDALVNPLDAMGGFLDNPRTEEIGRIQEQYGKASYLVNYAYYLEMANALPLIPKPEEGMVCSETIVAAFNIALLIMHEHCVKTLYGYDWTSNPNWSLDAFIHLLDNPLPFDARAILPAGILKHCQDNLNHWEDKGSLMMEEHYVLEEDFAKNKNKWRAFKDALLYEAPEKSRQFLSSPVAGLHQSYSSDNDVGMFSKKTLLTLTSTPIELKRKLSSPLMFLGLVEEDEDFTPSFCL